MGQSSSAAGQDASAAGNSVEGCLGGSAGKFSIIDKAGTTYDLQLPATADSSKLNSHIGQEVRVSGSMNNAKDSSAAGAAGAASSASQTATGSSSSSSHPSISVTKIDKIADTCSTNTTGSNPTSH
jgi:hypothetical protein